MIKLSEKPAELSGGGATLVNAIIYFLIRLHVVELTPEDIAMLTLGLNVVAQAIVYVYMRWATTSRANPTTVDGTPLAVAPKAKTRGIPKSE